MPNFSSPIGENYSVNNFSMQEKTPIGKINLRGNIENKDFISKAGKILGMILPKETCTTSTKEKITSIWLGPNEWLIVSNEKLSKETNILDLENTLFDGISKNNLGSVTNVTDHFTIFTLSGSNIFQILSKGSPFDFESSFFTDNKAAQTILHNVDIIIHKKTVREVDLYVRRSFSKYLWNWLKDSSKFLES